MAVGVPKVGVSAEPALIRVPVEVADAEPPSLVTVAVTFKYVATSEAVI